MCLAIPGKVVEIFKTHDIKMGRIDYAGTIKTACLEYVPEVDPGQYVIVHAGFAISVLDEEDAQKSLEIWRELVEAVEKEDAEALRNAPDQN
ncbi:hydrogenase isoenzymes formation protein HypC [bacterium BMS3Abin05]|nr:hydrogenase isoenzymes formation protein HypC [bacterium BMS3Abin05]GBE26936.1 hydrogenase isoenzymes formation protein HypC [bacterium BMS3Bbin03]HDZ12328.1 HypC/HybG/HupF family hydrogenase formation chaperone [Bacteroidota bacterium]